MRFIWTSSGWKCACCNLQMRSFFSLHYYILYIIIDYLASLYVLFNCMVNFSITCYWDCRMLCYHNSSKKNCLSPVLVTNKLVTPLILWHILIYCFTSSFVSCYVCCLMLYIYIVIILHFYFCYHCSLQRWSSDVNCQLLALYSLLATYYIPWLSENLSSLAYSLL